VINSYHELRSCISQDLSKQASKEIYLDFFIKPIVRFTVLLRFNEFLKNRNSNFFIRAIPMLWFKRLSIRLGFSIPLNVFAPGLAIVHYGLIVVSPAARIGRNCRIHTGVNIGASSGFSKETDLTKFAPKIGHNCYIGPGAKIFGPINIGNDCVIGANAVVNKTIDFDGVSIGGVPAKVISEKSSLGRV
jgi:serine O-acetyltransferase